MTQFIREFDEIGRRRTVIAQQAKMSSAGQMTRHLV